MLQVATPVVLAAAIDLLYQGLGGADRVDYAYYPRVRSIPSVLKCAKGVTVLVAWAVLVGAYWIDTSRRLGLASLTYGTPVLPERVVCTAFLTWGFLWAADAATRVRRTTLAVAVAFSLVSLWLTWNVNWFIVQE
jgi:hypothetical protein